jgi:hypothetical protein
VTKDGKGLKDQCLPSSTRTPRPGGSISPPEFGKSMIGDVSSLICPVSRRRSEGSWKWALKPHRRLGSVKRRAPQSFDGEYCSSKNSMAAARSASVLKNFGHVMRTGDLPAFYTGQPRHQCHDQNRVECVLLAASIPRACTITRLPYEPPAMQEPAANIPVLTDFLPDIRYSFRRQHA